MWQYDHYSWIIDFLDMEKNKTTPKLNRSNRTTLKPTRRTPKLTTTVRTKMAPAKTKIILKAKVKTSKMPRVAKGTKKVVRRRKSSSQ
jgi:hypothetical protein